MKRIIPSLAAFALIALTLSLGFWQLRRADYKDHLAQVRDAAALGTPIEITQVLSPDGALRVDTETARERVKALPYGLRVHLRGHWLAEHTVFIDNRTLKGIAGFHVVTPFALADGGLVVAVNRGWVARDLKSRNLLPKVASDLGTVSFDAWLETPQKALELGGARARENSTSEDNAGLWQNFDAQRLARRSKVAVAPWLARQSKATAFGDGLNREWPAPANDVAKHQGYAFQWFGLSVLTALLWLWFVVVKPRRARSLALNR
jgi:surfeit locus 1 family protein